MKHFTPLDNIVSLIVGCIIAIPICIASVSYQKAKQMEVAMQNRKPEYKYICQIVEKEVEVPVPVVRHDTVFIVDRDGKTNSTSFTKEELDMIICLVHYEAGNQDEIGQRLVADSVFNRVRSSKFPNTVEEVVKQNVEGAWQYSVVGAGVLKNGTKYCTEEERQIVYEEALKQLDRNVIYFKKGSYHSGTKKLYQHGDHYFSALKGV